MKKAKLYYTNARYSYIKVTRNDCFNWDGAAICDNCNKDMEDEIYLIFILGRAICKECFDEWNKRAKTYEEDLYLQKQNHISWYNAHGFEIEE